MLNPMFQFSRFVREFSFLLLPPALIIPFSGLGRLDDQHVEQNQRLIRKHRKGMNKGVPKLTREGLIINLYLMKIHFLILKLFIIKEFSSWMMKVFH
jgi:hypothetical protein